MKIGTIVGLKSGGPFMTVQQYRKDKLYVLCYWFDGNCILHEGWFRPETLNIKKN